MANLLSMLGLGSSGVPVSLDDETAQLMAQSPTSGWSALMGAQQGGIAPQQMQQYMAQAGMPETQQQDDGSQASAQDANAVASDSTGNVASQDSKVAKGDMQNAVDAKQVDQSGYSGDDSSGASGSAGAAPNNSDNASTASNASADQSGNTASSPDATTSSQGGLLGAVGGKSAQPDASSGDSAEPSFGSKLVSILKNPLIDTSLMNAGFGMMAASRPGTPWYSAIGQGAQTGMQTYNQLAQQQIKNAMAQQKLGLEMQHANDEHASSQAATAQTQANTAGLTQKLAYNTSLRNYIGSTPSNQITPQGIIAHGGGTSDVEAMFPGVDVSPPDDSGVSRIIDKRTGRVVSSIQGTKFTKVGAGESMYNGSQLTGGQSGSSVGQVTPQPLIQGGITPEQMNTTLKPFQDAEQAARSQGDQIDQFMTGMQSKSALSGNPGGVIGSGWRAAEQALGFNDQNNSMRQMFQRMNITQEMSLLPPGAKPNKFLEQQLSRAAADPSNASPAQMLQLAAASKVFTDLHATDNAARQAYISANNGSTANSKAPITITLNGMQKSYPAGTSMQKVADDAKAQFVDTNPAIINPEFINKNNINDSQIQGILSRARSDKGFRAYAQKQGILLPTLFGGK